MATSSSIAMTSWPLCLSVMHRWQMQRWSVRQNTSSILPWSGQMFFCNTILGSTSLCLFPTCRVLCIPRWISQYDSEHSRQVCSALRFLPTHALHSTSADPLEWRAGAVSSMIVDVLALAVLDWVSFMGKCDYGTGNAEFKHQGYGCGFSAGARAMTQRTAIDKTTERSQALSIHNKYISSNRGSNNSTL